MLTQKLFSQASLPTDTTIEHLKSNLSLKKEFPFAGGSDKVSIFLFKTDIVAVLSVYQEIDLCVNKGKIQLIWNKMISKNYCYKVNQHFHYHLSEFSPENIV